MGVSGVVPGLDQAYRRQNGLFVKNNTLYIAGTKSPKDVHDDMTLMAAGASSTQRFADAAALIESRDDIQFVTGHSLGGAVADAIGERYRLESLAIGSPLPSKGKSFAPVNDVVSGVAYPLQSVMYPAGQAVPARGWWRHSLSALAEVDQRP